MVIGSAKADYIRPFHPRLELGISRQLVSGIRVVQGEGFFEKIKYVHIATGGSELFGDVSNDHARDRALLQAANHRQHVYIWFCHRFEPIWTCMNSPTI